MITGGITTLTETTFDHALTRAPTPLLVEFWAEGCGPCQALIPILEQIATDHSNQLRVATVRLDDNPVLAQRHQIMALPTLVLFTNGHETTRITTAPTKAQLLDELASALPLVPDHHE
ncbi:thioredoxin 1 [Lipingzhangella halophila]|uniref:Thioredoxin n=1 Tax=Lipingzhangella halophila TaxID=1783352 RepID=A0A7W7RFN1_9ACTN|nr:thioredoxin domain-containing protein [Lipingzhangella halophila]MBB4931116.1 thioredoxin 1 [Lipingzhangella halophila]